MRNLILLTVVSIGTLACQSGVRSIEIPPGVGVVDYCFGGELDGKECSDEDAAKRCKEGGGSCAQTQAAALPPTYNQVGDNCQCKCVNLWGPNLADCGNQLKTSCGLANNCDADACDSTSCTWTNTTCPAADG